MTFARGQSGSKRVTRTPRAGRAVGAGRRRFSCEALEDRRLLSAGSNGPSLTELEAHLADPLAGAPFARVGIEVFGSADASPLALTGGPQGYTPSQIRHAYGFDQIYFSNGGVIGDGTGQTIAIIVAYHSPTIEHDLGKFDEAFGIPAPPSFTIIDQSGGTLDPKGQGTLNWEAEAALDVEWTHAMAPGANIVLIEGAGTTFAQLVSDRDPLNPTGAVETARTLPGVSVISMSWGADEFSTETNYDTKFTTPSGHTGITFVAATGDSGSPGTYPAYSPNVLAVGGTALVTDAAGNITIENGWDGSGGGISQFESHPSYQTGVVTQSTTKRTMPDVSLDADPSTSSDTTKGIPIYDSYNNGTTTPWNRIGGTSFSAPVWSSLIAIANQGRALSGLAALNGRNDTLPLLYSMSSSNFNDITSGSNGGFTAGAGYDLVTGRGTPRQSGRHRVDRSLGNRRSGLQRYQRKRRAR